MAHRLLINGEEQTFESFFDARRSFGNSKYTFGQEGKGKYAIHNLTPLACSPDALVCFAVV
jgi:hypothetical protein